jgi:tetrahydromethanopterin S-methyltransferase subunit D
MDILGFAILAAALVVTGTAAVSVLWRRLDGPDDLHVTELLTGGAIAGLGGWLAIHWALAITKTLVRASAAAVAIAFVLAAVVVAIRVAPRVRALEVPRDTVIALGFLVPVLCWTIFILWRGTVVPPLNHDALAYHLPKAVLMMRAHGFERFVAPDTRVGGLPANYELLLTDVLILGGSDRITEWIGTASYLLFLLAAAAVAQRWRTGPAGSIAAVLATASAPLVLLHSGADKNDLLVAWLGAAALLFGARWCTRGGRMSAALAMLAAVLAAGTKPNAGAFVLALLPFALWRIVRLLRERRLALRDGAITAVFAVGIVLLCGGWSYLSSFFASPASTGAASVAPAMVSMQYGDWFNLWQFPWLLATIPFHPQNGVWVPWAGEYWFWPHYELFWSHYGFAFTAALLLLPLAFWRFRSLDGERATERRIATAAGLIAVAIMLPVVSRPIGFYGTYPRYLLAVLPLVHCWTIAPIASALWARRRTLAYGALGVLTAVFVYYAAMCAEYDRFTPMEFVAWAARNPGTRAIPFMGGRAASVVDRRAGPHDMIAVEGSFETWVYPAYGAKLSRPVVFLPPDAMPADVPGEANWVIIDRSWHTIWASTMRDMGDGWKQLANGKALPEDVRFYELLRKDPRFELVYRSDRFNQAVFRRVAR